MTLIYILVIDPCVRRKPAYNQEHIMFEEVSTPHSPDQFSKTDIKQSRAQRQITSDGIRSDIPLHMVRSCRILYQVFYTCRHYFFQMS
jgi:hypothetical protein